MRSFRQSRLRVLGFTLVLAVGLSACTSSSLTPIGELVTANDAQFSTPVSAAVTAGSTGLESSGPADEGHWWLTSAEADVTVSNNAEPSSVVDITATLVPPPCPGPVEVVVNSPGSPSTRLTAGPGGKLLSLRLDLPRASSKTIHLSILTPLCRIATDPRPLYAGLFALKAQTPQTIVQGQ